MANNQLDNLDDSILSKNSLHISRLEGGKKKKRKTRKAKKSKKTKKSKKAKKSKKVKKSKKTKKVKFSSPQARLLDAMS